MKWPSLVETMIKFFETGFEREQKLRLVALLHYFDYHQRALPNLEELQQAIEIFGEVSIIREGSEIYFQQGRKHPHDVSPMITSEELKAACEQYSKEFRETYSHISKSKKRNK